MPPEQGREAVLGVVAERLPVPRGTLDRLDRLVALVVDEQARQNLVSGATLPDIWTRHVLDSAQLLFHVEQRAGTWLDVGSGAGFPGLVVAILSDFQVTLAEPRRLRAEFLARAAEKLGLGDRVAVRQAKAEAVTGRFGFVSARAVAPVAALFAAAAHLAGPGTAWLLPKGRSAEEELASARETWQGAFRLVPSVTDPEAAILLASNVARRRGPGRKSA